MKKSKRGLLTLAVMVVMLAALVLSGCGKKEESAEIRVGALKGPTTIGLLHLMDEAEKGNTQNTYTFTMASAADELTALVVKGDLDIALLPANVAAIVYQKTDGGVTVLDVNTLGVLYLVSGRDDITGVADLAGRTVYLTGKGTTPDYCLQYLLAQNGLSLEDVTLEYKSEATEVAAVLSENPDAVGLLPQPFVTVACAQNDALKVCASLTEEWDKVAEDGSSLLTGVTIVRNDFLKEHKKAVEQFLKDHKESADFANSNVEETAALCVAQEIIAKEPVAQKAIPSCNITCMTGSEMKEALSGYLKVLYELNPTAVGGELPADDFYYE